MVGVSALGTKLLRDLWAVKSQILAIGLVLGAGIAMVVGYWGTFDSLRSARAAYYERYRFADVFARAVRVPARVGDSIAAIPGVKQVSTRVVMDVALDLPSIDDPATARLVSAVVPRQPVLNDVRLIRGRWMEPGRPDEVLVSAAFADKNRFDAGSRVAAVVNGRRRVLEIVGVVASPEYIYSLRPGEMLPDDSRFGIFWMEQRALAAAFDMEGGFNDVALTLTEGASLPDVLDRLDAALRPYGGAGAVSRSQQLSNWFLDNELMQLETAGTAIPIVFFLVAVFLVNLVLARIVSIQRSQIAALKALGYSRRQIGRHYVGWGLAVVAVGAVTGAGAGYWLGSGMVALYQVYFELPELAFRLQPPTVLAAIAAGLAAGLTGSLGAVWRAVRMPPAEAMRPASPPRYKRTLPERLQLTRGFSVAGMMVYRNLVRRPIRSTLAIVGIGFGAAMMVVGMFSIDAIDVLRITEFDLVQREDVTLTFREPRSSSVRYEVERLPGVWSVEPFRFVPVRVRFGHRTYQGAVLGLEARPRLHRIIDSAGTPMNLQGDGLLLSRVLADRLQIRAGDVVTIEVLEGHRVTRHVVVDALVDDYLGMQLYMKASALHAMLLEGSTASGAFLQTDRSQEPALFARLKQTPGVAGVNRKRAALDSFNATLDKSMNIMIVFNVLFSSIITIGVVYNAARVALSERSRDLASLRVLGFTRREISFILLGELSVLTLAAIPIGLALGYGMAGLLVQALSTELYRFPLAVSSKTFAWSAITVAVSAVGSGLVVRRRLDELDLVAVLKAAE